MCASESSSTGKVIPATSCQKEVLRGTTVTWTSRAPMRRCGARRSLRSCQAASRCHWAITGPVAAMGVLDPFRRALPARMLEGIWWCHPVWLSSNPTPCIVLLFHLLRSPNDHPLALTDAAAAVAEVVDGVAQVDVGVHRAEFACCQSRSADTHRRWGSSGRVYSLRAASSWVGEGRVSGGT